MATEPILVAAISAVPATIAALAAYRTSRETSRKADNIAAQVTPSNGTRTAVIVEQLTEELQAVAEDVRAVKQDVQYHVTVQHGRGPTKDA